MEDKHREIISNHIACLRWHTLTMRWQPGSFWLQFVYVMKSFHLRHHWLGSSLSLDEQMHRPYGSKTGQSTLSLIALRSLGGRTKCVWRWIETMAWNRMALLVAGHPRWGQFVLLQLFPRSQSKLFGLHRLGHDVGILNLRTTTSRHHEILHLNAYAVWVCLSRQRPPASGAPRWMALYQLPWPLSMAQCGISWWYLRCNRRQSCGSYGRVVQLLSKNMRTAKFSNHFYDLPRKKWECRDYLWPGLATGSLHCQQRLSTQQCCAAMEVWK